MLNRNFDNLITKNMFPVEEASSFGQENRNFTLQKYDGKYFNYTLTAVDIFSTWNDTAYYNNAVTGLNSTNKTMIWPGGSGGTATGWNTQAIKAEQEDYDDYNLFHPFYGTNADPGREVFTYDIYPQKHYSDAPVYNAETDKWTRTIHREFRNISGKTLTIKEQGIYYYTPNGIALVSRELLETPIEVINRDYFQLAYTYECQNPHANEEVKKSRQYTCPICEIATTNFSKTVEITDDIETGNLVLFSINTMTNVTEPTKGTFSGTGINNITEVTSMIQKNAFSATSGIREEIFKATITGTSEFNFSYVPPTGAKKISCEMFPFKDTVTNISFVSATSTSGTAFEITKGSTDKNILWVISKDLPYSSELDHSIIQTDENYCDMYVPYSDDSLTDKTQDIFVDCTSATVHSFSTKASGNYIINRLNITCSTDLFKEINQ